MSVNIVWHVSKHCVNMYSNMVSTWFQTKWKYNCKHRKKIYLKTLCKSVFKHSINMLSKHQLNHNSTQPQPNITLVGLDTKMTLQTTPPHPHKLNISCNWTDFDENLKLASWELVEQIPTIKLTFVQLTFVHIRNISAVTDPILTKL